VNGRREVPYDQRPQKGNNKVHPRRVESPIDNRDRAPLSPAEFPNSNSPVAEPFARIDSQSLLRLDDLVRFVALIAGNDRILAKEGNDRPIVVQTPCNDRFYGDIRSLAIFDPPATRRDDLHDHF